MWLTRGHASNVGVRGGDVDPTVHGMCLESMCTMFRRLGGNVGFVFDFHVIHELACAWVFVAT